MLFEEEDFVIVFRLSYDKPLQVLTEHKKEPPAISAVKLSELIHSQALPLILWSYTLLRFGTEYESEQFGIFGSCIELYSFRFGSLECFHFA